MTESAADVLARIAATIESRKGADPAQSYVAARFIQASVSTRCVVASCAIAGTSPSAS